jgi:hypothetical protein
MGITARPLTVTPDSGKTKVYGDADPELTYGISGATSLAYSDTLSGALGRAESENVGPHEINLGALIVVDGNSGLNYTLTCSPGVTMSITARLLTVTPDSGMTKVYGEDDPTLTANVTAGTLAFSDVLSGSLARATGIDVGSYVINGIGTLIAGGNSGLNYDITFSNPDSIAMSITQRPLTVQPDTGKTKVYGDADPTLTANVTEGSLVSGESLSGSLARATGENVGMHLINGLGSLIAGSAQGSNYNITFSNPAATTMSITRRPLEVTPDAGKTKVYGEDDPTLTYEISSGNLVEGDEFSGTLGRAGGVNVGSYAIDLGTLAVVDGNSGLNYTLTCSTGVTMGITARPLEVTPDSDQTKVYDGNTTTPTLLYQISSGSLAYSDGWSGALGRAGGENVGAHEINLGALTVADGNSGLNYTLTCSSGVTMSIIPRTLTATPNTDQTKVYGDADPTPFTYHFTVGTLVTGDSLSGALGRDSGEDVGSSYVINQGDLHATSNYTFSFINPDSIAMSITQRPLTVKPNTGLTKVYGDADPTLTAQVTAGTTLAFSDTFSNSLARATGNDVGSYLINGIGTLIAGGNSGLNYDVTFTNPDSAAMSITKRPLTVTPDVGKTKVYGDDDPELTYGFGGGTSLAYSDTLSGALGRAGGVNVGSYAIDLGTLAVVDGNSGNNYTLTCSTGVTMGITARPLEVTPDSDQTKVYDGNTTMPTLTYQISSGSLAYSDGWSGVLGRAGGENVGSHAINLGALTVADGNSGLNYTLTCSSGVTMSITLRPLTVTPRSGQTKVYDEADPPLTYDITSGSLVFGEFMGGALGRAPGTDVGLYAINIGSLTAGSNYDLTFNGNGVNLEITKADQAITFDPLASKTEGEPDFDLLATASSGLDVSYESSNELVATVDGITVTIVGVGTTTITASQLGNGNYNPATPVERTLSVYLALVADAGDDRVVDKGVEVELDGSGSYDPNDPEVILTYAWSFVSVPSGSGITVEDLDNPAAQKPKFTPDLCGDYLVQLEVTSGYGSATATVLLQAKQNTGDYTEKLQSGKKSYLDRPTRKLVSTSDFSVRNLLTGVAMTDVELRVLVTITSPPTNPPGSFEMPGTGWSYNTAGGYFSKVLGDLAAPPQSGDTVLGQLMFRYGTTVRFTYELQVWGKY